MTALRQFILIAIIVAALWATHPAPPEGLFDTAYVAHRFMTSAFGDAMRFYVGYHTYPRPLRALEWWGATQLVADSAAGYHAINVLFVGLALWAVVLMGTSITGSLARGYFAGACMAVSYVTVYPLAHFPYGVQLALAFLGFSALISGGKWRVGLGVVGILLASLAHEVFLTFTLLPWLFHRLVRPLPRWSVAASFAGLPLWILLQFALRPAPVPGGGFFNDGVGEHVSRVVVSALSAGLPAEMMRIFPVAPPFARIREVLLAGPAVLLLVAVSLPTALALLAALSRPWPRRTWFLVLWWLMGTVPLLLPVGTPEAYHLAGAMPALFLLWGEGFDRLRHSAGWWAAAARPVALVTVIVWMALHGYARIQVFRHDFQLVGRAARSLRAVVAASPEPVVALFPPAQVGGHHGYWPALPAQGACLLEPSWVWRASAPPSLPSACRRRNTVVVGPLTPETEAMFLGARTMLHHPTATAFDYHGPTPILSVCLVRQADVLRDARGVWWRYTLEGAEHARMVRLEFSPEPVWRPVVGCRDDAP